MIHNFLSRFLEIPLLHKYLLNDCYIASTLLDIHTHVVRLTGSDTKETIGN